MDDLLFFLNVVYLSSSFHAVTFLFLSKNCLKLLLLLLYYYYYYYYCYCYYLYSYTRNRFYWVTFKLEDIHQPKFCATAYNISQTKPVLLQQIVTNCNKFHKYGNKLLNLLSDLITFGCDKLINVSNAAVKSTKNHRLAEHQNISKAKYQMQSSEGVL